MDEVIEPDDIVDPPAELGHIEAVEAELVPYDEPDDTVAADEPIRVETPAYRGTGIRWSYLFGAVLTVAIIILAAQNTESVEFEFLTWNITAPLAAVVLATAFVAVVIDELLGVIWRFQRRRQLRQKAELNELRAKTGQPKRRRRQKP